MKRVMCCVVICLMVMLGMSVEGQAANKVTQVSLGSRDSAIIREDGSLWMWGYNSNGQLGDGTTTDRYLPTKIMDNVVSVSLGDYHTAAIKTDGSLWTWGSNYSGELGDGTKTNRLIPTKIMDNVASVDMGYSSAAIKTDGSLWTWGSNYTGQLGDGTKTSRSVPTKIMDNVESISMATSSGSSAAIKTDGSLWMWGVNSNGQLGDGTTTSPVIVPTKIMDNVASVSLGAFHSAAIKTNGSLWMWGNNYHGELGDGTTTNRLVPTKIMDNVTSVSMRGTHSAAIKTNGSLWMWGFNRWGQLGNGSTGDRCAPMKVMDSVASVSIEGADSAAIKTDGSLWMWGYNSNGQLGDGTTTDRYVPTKIIDGSATDIQYHLMLQDASTGITLSGVAVTYNGQTYTSDENGLLTFKGGDILYAPITFTKSGFKDKTIIVKDMKAYENNTIQLESETTGANTFNLDLGSTTIDGPSVNLGPWSFPLFTMDTGVNLGNLSMKQKVDLETKTIYQSIGVDESVVDKEGDAYWKGTYKNLKNIANGFGKKTDREFYNDFRSARKYLKQHNMKLGVSCDGNAYGYCEYSYASGQPVFKEGGLVVLVEPSVELKQRIPQTANICYIRFKLTGSFGGKFTLSVADTNINDPKLLAEITAAVNAQLGIGADVLIANVEGGFEGEIGTNITLGNNTASLEDALRVYLTAKLYAKASIAGWESDPLELPLVDWQMYPQTNTMSLMNLNDYDNYHLPDRDYLDTISTMALDDTNIAFSQSSVYPYGSPKIVTLANGRMMALWIGDNGTKATGNHTTLMYTLRDAAGNWSPAQAVYESGRTDLTPVVAVEGNNVHVLWHNGTEVFPDNITMTEMLTKMNLVYSCFDGTGFSTPVTVSTEGSGKLQQLPAIDASNGTVMVSWVENSTNDPYLANGTNSLISRSLSGGVWSDAKVLSTDVGYVTSTVVDSENQLVYYSVDTDPTTEGNESINVMTADGSSTSMGAGTNLKAIDGTIYALNGGTLWTIANNVMTDTGVPCTVDYDIAGDTILYTQKTGFKNEVYTTTKDTNGTWSIAVPLTAYDSFLRYFDATADTQGNIILAMDKVGVNDAYDGTAETSPYSTTDFIITSAEDRYDLAVNETLYYDTAALAAGGTIEVTAEVENTSTQTVDNLKLTWLDAADTVVSSQDIAQSIGVGETAEVKTTYTLPSPLSHQTVKLKIEAVNVTEDNVNNNTATMEYGFSDVALESGELTKNADGTGTITVTVKNTGVDTAEGITVDLYKNGIEGEKLGQQSVGSIASGQSKTLTYALTKEQMACADEYDGKLFYLDAKSTSVESDYANNTNELLLDPVAAVGIALDQEAVTLTAGDTAQLKATLSPADAVSKTHWISDDTTVVTVDDTGKITAVAAGTAKVTAIAGEVTKQCTVTVEKGPAAKAIVRSISLEGNIAINYYLRLDASVNPSTIGLKFWKDGDAAHSVKVPYDSGFTTVYNDETLYGFSYDLPAKGMTDNVKAQVYVETPDGETVSGEVYDYSIQTYAQNQLSQETTPASLKALLKAMLNYGAGSQKQFTYNTSALANNILTTEEQQVPNAALGDEFNGSIVKKVENPLAVFKSVSLVLESETTQRCYVALDASVVPENAKMIYQVAGSNTTKEAGLVKSDNGLYYADIKNIAAKDLKNMYEAYIVENDQPISDTLVYGPMTYAKTTLTAGGDSNLTYVVNAMVDYSTKAIDYFSNR